MIWLIIGEESHQIVSTNRHVEGDKHQLWVTRASGKSLKVFENKDKSEVDLLKEAIDYAIETGEKIFRIK